MLFSKSPFLAKILLTVYGGIIVNFGWLAVFRDKQLQPEKEEWSSYILGERLKIE